MENLYYIPSIEEFRIGFKCEILLSQAYSVNNIKDIWKECIWGRYNPIYNLLLGEAIHNNEQIYEYILPLISSKLVRVKYLDKSDIESLGFKEDKVNNYFVEENLFHGEKVILKIFLSRTSITISLINIDRRKYDDWIPSIEYPGEFYEINDLFLFVGEIKNKSELEILLKQLRIDGNFTTRG